MTAYLSNVEAWQESWDRQQSAYLPDREHRFAAMLDALAAVGGREPSGADPSANRAADASAGLIGGDESAGTDASAGVIGGHQPAGTGPAAAAAPGQGPRLLDLAGGTGTITLRALQRFPGTTATVLDQDPVLLAIAEASLRGRATVVSADLNSPEWTGALPTPEYDAVFTATALHWLEADRVAGVYAEVRGLLRPGGIFVNADHMPDDGLGEFSKRLQAWADAGRDARYAAGAVLPWRDWWEHVGTEEFFRPLLAERERIYPAESHHTEWMPSVSWHVEALRKAGFSEAGILWRGGTDAAVIGIR